MNIQDTIEKICANSQQEKIVRDKLEINYLNKGDFIICDYVINKIPETDYIPYYGIPIFKNYAIKRSLIEFKKFSKENYQDLLTIIDNVEFIKDYPLHNSAVQTVFNHKKEESNIQVISPGYISAYHLPKKIYNIDIVALGHEHCHALKENNYKEHKNSLALGEVIPIFYEIINYENDFLRKKHLQQRLFDITYPKYFYLAISEILNGNINNYKLSFLNENIDKTKNMYEYVQSCLGSYLIGFYYAIILYSMYKKDPIKILNLVNKVLSHKITTLDMLKTLNIYHSIYGEKFEKEITTMKKVLSK